MFSKSKSIDNLQELFLEMKDYFILQKKFLKLDLTEKLIVLFSAIAIAAIILILVSLILLFLTFALAYYIGNMLGSLPLGFGIIALALTLILLLFYNMRRKWVIQPLARFLSNLLLNNSSNDENNS